MNKTRISSIVKDLQALCESLCLACSSYFTGVVNIIDTVEDFDTLGDEVNKSVEVLKKTFLIISKLNSYNTSGYTFYLDDIDHKDLDIIIDFITTTRNREIKMIRVPKLNPFGPMFLKSIYLYDEVYKSLVDVRRLAYGYDRPKDES